MAHGKRPAAADRREWVPDIAAAEFAACGDPEVCEVARECFGLRATTRGHARPFTHLTAEANR